MFEIRYYYGSKDHRTYPWVTQEEYDKLSDPKKNIYTKIIKRPDLEEPSPYVYKLKDVIHLKEEVNWVPKSVYVCRSHPNKVVYIKDPTPPKRED
jgi:hypothetical protein